MSDKRKNNPHTKRLKHHVRAARLPLKNLFWIPVRKALQSYLKQYGRGASARIVKAIGCTPSDPHRWTCPKCEHYVEPSFSVGMSILFFLQSERITIDFQQDKPHETIFQQAARPEYASHNSTEFERVKRVAVVREGNDWETVQLN